MLASKCWGHLVITGDLANNPFVILDITPRSTREEINDAVQEAKLEAESVEDERRVDLARQDLTKPELRLKAELSYLLDCRPADARKTLRQMAKGTSWQSAINDLDGLSFINSILNYYPTLPEPERISTAELTVSKLEEVEADSILDAVQSARQVSGFDTVTGAQIRRALEQRKEEVAATLVAGLAQHADLPEAITRLSLESGRQRSPFSSLLLNEYKALVEPKMSTLEADVILRLKEFQTASGSKAFIGFEQTLHEWDRLAQPLQLADGSLGADEKVSSHLFRQIRSVALELNNLSDRHEDALRISAVASKVFAELPDASAMLAEDIAALEEISSDRTAAKHIAPFAARYEVAAKNIKKTRKIINRHGFTRDAAEPIGPLVAAFHVATKSCPNPGQIDVLIGLLRDLSIRLNNELEDRNASIVVMKFIMANFANASDEMKSRIRDDQKTLRRNMAHDNLNYALKNKDLNGAINHCDLLIELSDGDQRNEFLTLKAKVQEKIRENRVRNIGLAILVGLVGLIWGGSALFDELGKTNVAAEPYNPVEIPADVEGSIPPVDPTDEPSTAAPIEVPPVLPTPSSQPEPISAPDGAYGQILGRPELRYCLRENERLDYAQHLANSSTEIDRFNAAVDDYNHRCSSFRYQQYDMAAVKAEVARDADILRKEARDLVNGSSFEGVDENFLE